MDTNTFIQKVQDRFKTDISYDLVEFKDYYTKIKLICPVHGEVEAIPKSLLYKRNLKHPCPKCGVVEGRKGAKVTRFETESKAFFDKCKLVHGDTYDYSKVDYKTSSDEVVIVCKTHGEFLQKPVNHIQGNGCSKCSGKYIPSTEESLIELSTIFGEDITFPNFKYSGRKSKIKAICSHHGEFITSIELAKMGYGKCPECDGKQYRMTTDRFAMLSTELHDGLYSYDKVKYITPSDKVEITCKDHGAFFQLPHNHLAGRGCPHCSTRISSQEDKIVNMLDGEILVRSDRSIISPLELDVYLPNNSLAIEINGRIWHSEKYCKDKDYHKIKTYRCLEKGVNLLHFWDDEVDWKFPVVKSMILSRLGKSHKRQARKMRAQEVSHEDSCNFLNDNHLQGNSAASVRLGLYEGGELMQIMTFAKPRFTKSSEWEIVRIASKLDTVVVGGASKLLSHFVKTYKPESIVSYADLRYSTGGVYKSLGFTFSHNSSPNYFYTKSSKNISRYQAQKHLLPKLLGDKFDPNKSESENMLAANYNKVYDCGNAVYIWRKS